ncbi:ComF family protein [Fontimonas sp. SYSU GA230001]|uniref:ComF family protein n=1 Tax=Fontimonas sp. SYSU GA230001 TaxID=3142450 RepID=UPI0032B3CE87
MGELVDKSLGLVLPSRCRACGAALVTGQLCAACTADLPWNDSACARCARPMNAPGACPHCLQRPPQFDGAWAAFRLEAPVQHFVHALKYRADFAQARLLGELMAARLTRRAGPLPQLLIPVPLHRRRLRSRGYNQALEIARIVGRRLGIPVGASAAERVRATEDQIGQSAAARRRNMRDAFALRADLRGQHVALLDDVMTTGATLDELARACRIAGAARIEAWAAARTP